MKKVLLFLTALLPLSHSDAFQNPIRPGNLSPAAGLERIRKAGGQFEPVQKLTQARVVLADYGLIRRDFPFTTPLSEAAIDEWLLREGAWMARSQIQKGPNAHIHHPIPHQADQTRLAFRPKGYGRALLFSVLPPEAYGLSLGQSPAASVEDSSIEELFLRNSEGFFDTKGVGALNPKQGDHSDGLADLAEMIQEFSLEKLVRAVFQDSKEPLDTVESYAVLSLGFKYRDQDGESRPAGLILRQAHPRMGTFSIKRDKTGKSTARVEALLQRYGMSCAGQDFVSKTLNHVREHRILNWQDLHEGAIRYGSTNIQGFFGDPTRNAVTVVDFGTCLVLSKNLISISARFYNQDGTEFNFPVERDPKKAVSAATWGFEPENPENLQEGFKDNLALWTEDWVERLGTQDPQAFQDARRGLGASLAQHLEAEQARWRLAVESEPEGKKRKTADRPGLR